MKEGKFAMCEPNSGKTSEGRFQGKKNRGEKVN